MEPPPLPASLQPPALTLRQDPLGGRLRLALAPEKPPGCPARRGSARSGPTNETSQKAAVAGQSRHGGGRETERKDGGASLQRPLSARHGGVASVQ